jgi:hypothetical protein
VFTPTSSPTTTRYTGTPPKALPRTQALRLIVHAAAFGLLLLLASCAEHHPQTGTPQTAPSLTDIVNTILTLEPSQRLEYLQSHLGSPDQTAETTVSNLHEPDRLDTLRTLVYADITLTTYLVEATGEEHLVRLDVRTPQFLAPNGARIGMNIGQVKSSLSVLWQDAQVITYILPQLDSAPDLLTLWHDEQVITLVSLEFYTD